MTVTSMMGEAIWPGAYRPHTLDRDCWCTGYGTPAGRWRRNCWLADWIEGHRADIPIDELR
jgi:hypothetical protein